MVVSDWVCVLYNLYVSANYADCCTCVHELESEG